jgi:hypothetical protein
VDTTRRVSPRVSPLRDRRAVRRPAPRLSPAAHVELDTLTAADAWDVYVRWSRFEALPAVHDALTIAGYAIVSDWADDVDGVPWVLVRLIG